MRVKKKACRNLTGCIFSCHDALPCCPSKWGSRSLIGISWYYRFDGRRLGSVAGRECRAVTNERRRTRRACCHDRPADGRIASMGTDGAGPAPTQQTSVRPSPIVFADIDKNVSVG